MKFIQGKPRNQWEMYCLDAHVDADNEVRRIDLFVDSLNLSELGFQVEFVDNTVILPEIWTRGLVKKESNFTKRYEKTDPSKIFA